MTVHERLLAVLRDGNGACCCDEMILHGKRVDPPTGHDCDYVRRRNELIPQARRIASQKIGDAVSKRPQWTRCFSDTMDELSKPLLNGAERVSPP